MNDANFALAEQLVPVAYVRQGAQSRHTRESLVKSLLAQRRLPTHGWDETSIELLLHELASMDSNNFVGNAGVGEREGRVVCPLVARRHYRLAHGIGRSGDIAEVQPKAAGSSLMLKLANALALDALRRAGAPMLSQALVLPLATGMTMTLTLLALRRLRGAAATHVIWPRIDQKACFKAILAAGLTPVVVDGVRDDTQGGEQIVTDVPAVRAAIERLGPDAVLCVLSTTSCFAPRAPDDVLALARECAAKNVPHVVNNAYGVQCRPIMKALDAAMNHGRVDAIIQSTDKNFLVPVGGAIVAVSARGKGCAPHAPALLAQVSKTYAGRASAAPVLDLFVTLLYLGADGWDALLAEREHNFRALVEQVGRVAEAHGERVLSTPANPISRAITLRGCLRRGSGGGGSGASPGEGAADGAADASAEQLTAFGSRLFSRLVSGARVVVPSGAKTIEGVHFQGFGAHCADYPTPYFTVASAVGQRRAEIELFAKRLDAVLGDFGRLHRKLPREPTSAHPAELKDKGSPPLRRSPKQRQQPLCSSLAEDAASPAGAEA